MGFPCFEKYSLIFSDLGQFLGENESVYLILEWAICHSTITKEESAFLEVKIKVILSAEEHASENLIKSYQEIVVIVLDS